MDEHWLTRPRTIRRLWQIFAAILAATVLAQLAAEIHPHFAMESLFGAYALYGFGACAALILLAKGLGVVLKRKDSYYDE